MYYTPKRIAKIVDPASGSGAFLLAQGYNPTDFGGVTFITAWRRGSIAVHWQRVDGRKEGKE